MQRGMARMVMMLVAAFALGGLALFGAPRLAGSGTPADFDTGGSPGATYLACSSTCVDPDPG